MLTLALTGGIATGKSTFAKLFLEREPRTVLFDSDREVHTLQEKPEVIAAMETALGESLTNGDGTLDRPRLRELVFGRPDRRKAVEGVLHPLVRAACHDARIHAGEDGAPYFLADVPLLYESDFPLERDLDIVVACGPATQRARLMARNGFASELAEKILAAQQPLSEKMHRAGVVLWNGGEPDSLRRQTDLLVTRLRARVA